MRQKQLVNQKAEGFTLIEVLMAVLLIAILATIAITQFTNFARDTRNAATKENLGILRNAIQKHYGTMRLRCGVTNDMHPTLTALSANDITADAGTGCVAGDLSVSDRYFVAGGLPENPWSGKDCTGAQRRQVQAGTTNMNVGTPLSAGEAALNSAVNCGWLYDESTGRIKAATNNNQTDPNGDLESAY